MDTRWRFVQPDHDGMPLLDASAIVMLFDTLFVVVDTWEMT